MLCFKVYERNTLSINNKNQCTALLNYLFEIVLVYLPPLYINVLSINCTIYNKKFVKKNVPFRLPLNNKIIVFIIIIITLNRNQKMSTGSEPYNIFWWSIQILIQIWCVFTLRSAFMVRFFSNLVRTRKNINLGWNFGLNQSSLTSGEFS